MVFRSLAFSTLLIPPDLERLTFSHNEDLRCKESKDIFEVPAWIYARPVGASLPEGALSLTGPWGAHPTDYNLCVEKTRFRPLLILTQREKKNFQFDDNPSYAYVANVRHVRDNTHVNQWYVAAIPLESVTSFVFQVLMIRAPILGVRGGHSQMRVFFGKDVILKPQFPANPKEELRLRELIFSAQGVGSPGQRLDLLRGIDGSFLMSLGVYTTNAKLFDDFIEFSSDANRQIKLALSKEMMINYLRAWIRDGNNQRLSRQFELLGNNCNSNHFRILDEILQASYTPAQREAMQHVPLFDPDQAERALKARGLVEKALLNYEAEPASVQFLATFNR
jgi:hypothetical protein